MLRHLAVFCSSIGLVLAATSLLGVGLVLVSYGPITPPASSASIVMKPRALVFYPRMAVADRAIMLFPANFVDPSQYEHLGLQLVQATGQPIIIVRPNLRIAGLSPGVISLQRLLPGVTDWTYIGHSAGAAQACRAAADATAIRPARIILLAGYCRQAAGLPTVAILATNDPFVHYAAYRTSASKTYSIQSNDHFFPVARNVQDPSFAAMERRIIAVLR